jgi:outer membrane protein OmpA-like peptidoglycan-associated protein
MESLVLAQQPATTGLKGEYFNGLNFNQKAFTRIDPQVAFDWNWRMPAPGVQREYFSVRWTGKLYAPVSGKYQFSATVDDGVRVWVDGKKVIDEWRKQDDSQFVGEIYLKAKQHYDLKVEYYNDWKGSIIYLFWKTPLPQQYTASRFPEMIPAHYLSPTSVQPTKTTAMVAKPPAKQTSKPAVVAAAKTPSTIDAQPVHNKRMVSSAAPSAPQLAVANTAPKLAETFIKLIAGETVVLRNVFFEQSEYKLLPESYEELDKLAKALLAQPNLEVMIAGHTDNVGDARLNQALSENRAKVVASYLTRHGVPEDRLEAKGYGGSHPLTSNATEGDRAKNRRVEISVK